MRPWPGAPAAALVLALLGCSRSAPLAPTPASRAGSVRVSRRPLAPQQLKGAESFGNSALLAVEPGIAGDRIVSVLEVPPADCAIVIARGSETIEDLDLLAYGEDGSALGNDEAPDREPSLLICPPHPARVVVAARIAQGHGIVALGSEKVPPAQAERAARRYKVKPRDPADPERLKAWPGLDALIVRERARVGGKFQDLRRVALALDAGVPTTLPASIEAGRCVHALFIPSDDVSHLDVAALDDQGRVLGRAVGSGRQRSLVVCSPAATEVTFEVRPHSGRGLAVAALSRSVAGTESEIQGEIVRRDVYPGGSLEAELASLEARLKRLGYTSPSRQATRAELKVGQRVALPLTLGGGCTRIDVLGGSPLRGVNARLWSESGALRAAGSGGGSVTLFGCGDGKQRLDLSAELSPGPVSVVLQREPDVPPELTRAPLAASRLVARMAGRGALLRVSAIGKPSELLLSAEQLTRVPAQVPADRCLEVDVGIEGGATGVELRALDVDSGVELDSAVGESAASVRLCAYRRVGLGSLNVRLELRTVSGSARALLATRLLAPAD